MIIVITCYLGQICDVGTHKSAIICGKPAHTEAEVLLQRMSQYFMRSSAVLIQKVSMIDSSSFYFDLRFCAAVLQCSVL